MVVILLILRVRISAGRSPLNGSIRKAGFLLVSSCVSIVVLLVFGFRCFDKTLRVTVLGEAFSEEV